MRTNTQTTWHPVFGPFLEPGKTWLKSSVRREAIEVLASSPANTQITGPSGAGASWMMTAAKDLIGRRKSGETMWLDGSWLWDMGTGEAAAAMLAEHASRNSTLTVFIDDLEAECVEEARELSTKMDTTAGTRLVWSERAGEANEATKAISEGVQEHDSLQITDINCEEMRKIWGYHHGGAAAQDGQSALIARLSGGNVRIATIMAREWAHGDPDPGIAVERTLELTEAWNDRQIRALANQARRVFTAMLRADRAPTTREELRTWTRTDEEAFADAVSVLRNRGLVTFDPIPRPKRGIDALRAYVRMNAVKQGARNAIGEWIEANQ